MITINPWTIWAPEGERNPICVQTWLKVSFNYVSIIGLLTNRLCCCEPLILLRLEEKSCKMFTPLKQVEKLELFIFSQPSL